MNGYKCFYRGKTMDVYAVNPLEARDKAAKVWKAKKAYEVTAILCEKDGKQIEHKTSSI